MENRFGVKDFISMTLLVVLIVSVWIAMKQYDRQWADMQQIRRRPRPAARDWPDPPGTGRGGSHVLDHAGAARRRRHTGRRADPFASIREARP